jgi:hypothetical protein
LIFSDATKVIQTQPTGQRTQVRQENQTNGLRNSDRHVTGVPKKMKHYKHEGKANAKHQIKKSKDGAKTTGCISDNTKQMLFQHSQQETQVSGQGQKEQQASQK